jgi:hypothetical protein
MHALRSEAERDSSWYLEVPPSSDLASWISHFRVIRGQAPSSAAPTTLRLLTDGCTGVVIDCGPSALSSPPVFMGVMQAATVVRVVERQEVIGVRFKPGGALPFVTSQLRELTGRRVPLPLLWGDLAQQMGHAARSATFRERVPAMEDCLRRRLRQRPTTAQGLLSDASMLRGGSSDPAELRHASRQEARGEHRAVQLVGHRVRRRLRGSSALHSRVSCADRSDASCLREGASPCRIHAIRGQPRELTSSSARGSLDVRSPNHRASSHGPEQSGRQVVRTGYRSRNEGSS